MATINLRNIPDRLKNRFKAICTLTNSNMTQVIVDFMAEIVRHHEREDKSMAITGPNSNLLDSLLKRQPAEEILDNLKKTITKQKTGTNDADNDPGRKTDVQRP